MFEGIILVIFLIIGGLTALLAFILVVLSIFRKSKGLLTVGLMVAVVPLVLYLITYWFYDIHIPALNKKQEAAYAGTYVMLMPGNANDLGAVYTQQPKLVLKTDNTFQLDKNEFTSFYGAGTWKAAASDDGQFEFKDSGNATLFWATPSNENKLEIDKDFEGKQQVIFVK